MPTRAGRGRGWGLACAILGLPREGRTRRAPFARCCLDRSRRPRRCCFSLSLSLCAVLLAPQRPRASGRLCAVLLGPQPSSSPHRGTLASSPRLLHPEGDYYHGARGRAGSPLAGRRVPQAALTIALPRARRASTLPLLSWTHIWALPEVTGGQRARHDVRTGGCLRWRVRSRRGAAAAACFIIATPPFAFSGSCHDWLGGRRENGRRRLGRALAAGPDGIGAAGQGLSRLTGVCRGGGERKRRRPGRDWVRIR